MSTMDRFMKNVIPVTESGCWLWEGPVDKKGYGVVYMAGQGFRAHRFAWELFREPIPKTLHVCHKCDVKCCVNPAHLYVGTNKDNMRDKAARNHKIKGESWHTSKLTEHQIREIRTLRTGGAKVKDLGKLFGVHYSQIIRICQGKCWRHVD